MSVKLYVTPTTLLVYLYLCCLLQHLNCASIDFEQLVKSGGLSLSRNRRENDPTKQENLFNVMRLLRNENFDSRENQQMLGEKRIVGPDFGTSRANSGRREALHLIGIALANGRKNPGKRRRRQSLKH